MAATKLSPQELEHQQRMLKKVGDRFRQLRQEKGEDNYEKFAFKHNINRSQYWRYENGEDMRLTTLLRLLEIHKISLPEFFKEGF